MLICMPIYRQYILSTIQLHFWQPTSLAEVIPYLKLETLDAIYTQYADNRGLYPLAILTILGLDSSRDKVSIASWVVLVKQANIENKIEQ